MDCQKKTCSNCKLKIAKTNREREIEQFILNAIGQRPQDIKVIKTYSNIEIAQAIQRLINSSKVKFRNV